MGSDVPETVAAIVAAHRAGTATPAQTVARSYQRIRDHNDPAIFISLRDEKDALGEAEALASRNADALPLFGVPVAVKDNIDVQGLPTTAACPAFSYSPAQDSTAVAKLRAAGAIIIGKTNLDQFATGLVGVRSPYGIPVNPIRADLIPGGSSSGSAVAVSAGLVPLALGTDTAGSGRVPAMLNNIVGLKPSLGLISNAGLVPACRTLDCISVFSLTVDDAMTALAVMAGPDGADPFSRDRPLGAVTSFPAQLRLGVPRNGQLIFFGDKASEKAYGEALDPSDRATAKAMSAAYKSAMIQTFCIPLAGSEDADRSSPRPARTHSPEPVQGWERWIKDIEDIAGVCETEEALGLVQERNRELLKSLSRERSDLYAELGNAFSARREALFKKAVPQRTSTQGVLPP